MFKCWCTFCILISEIYGRELVDLKQSRWEFLNTLFSVSEAVMFMQVEFYFYPPFFVIII